MLTIHEFIKTQIGKNDKVLDIGCGNKQYSVDLGCKKIITLDAWSKVCPDILLDLENNDIPFKEKSLDVILMIDFIEHVSKQRGKILIEQAKKIAMKSIILLTPLWWQDNAENVNNKDLWCFGNKYDYHKCLWTLEEFSEWKRVERKGNYFFGLYNCKKENIECSKKKLL